MSESPPHPEGPLTRHVQPPRTWVAWLIRIALALAVLAAVVWFAQYRQRISAATLQRGVARKMHETPARCSDHSRNGSSWACLVGKPPDPDCIVVAVTITGSWSIVDRPSACRYP